MFNIMKSNSIDTVFHLAALPRVQFSIAHPIESNDTNINGTLTLLEQARKAKVRRFVYSASSSAYGDQDTLPLVETMKPNPMSPYALQKLTGEHYCKLYNLVHGMETVSLRYFNVFGPRQSVGSVYAAFIPKFIDSYINNTRPTIFGDGKQSRDFTHIDNVVQANILAAATDNKKAFGDVFNVGASNQVSTSHVDKQIRTHLGTSLEPIYGEAVIEPKHTKADLTKIRSELGYEVLVDFDTGLKKTIEWFKNKG
jgi:nucleoside-diphosphate-sugar epimerase